MPRYYFKGESDGLVVQYKPNWKFDEFLFYGQFGEFMQIKNVGGSIVLIDLSSSYLLNKLHIGDLVIRNPHLEANVVRGHEDEEVIAPRVDLHDFDLHYARQRLKELERWRDEPGYREYLRDYHYGKIDQYFARPRLRQLAVPDDELERRIREHKELVKVLGGRNDADFVSSLTLEIESDMRTLDSAVKSEVEEYLRTGVIRKNQEKVIKPLVVVDVALEVYRKLEKVLGFVNERADYREAEKYWERVADWTHSGGYIFIGCIPGAREHIARHIEGSGAIGSAFFEDFIPRIFPTMDDFLLYSIMEGKDMNFYGAPVGIKREFPELVGFKSVVALEDLPAGVEVEKRVREGIKVNVVSGVEREETNKIIIVLAPWGRNEYGIHTIYPGEEFAPMLSDEEYWSRHAFIV